MLTTFHCRYRDFNLSTESPDQKSTIIRFVRALIECGKIPHPSPGGTEEFCIKILVNGEPFRVKGLVDSKAFYLESIKRINT